MNIYDAKMINRCCKCGTEFKNNTPMYSGSGSPLCWLMLGGDMVLTNGVCGECVKKDANKKEEVLAPKEKKN